MPQRLRVAIVGCGWVGGLQVDNGFAKLPELFEIVACCDTDAVKLDAFAGRYAIPARCPDLASVLARSDVDVVSICTPPSDHFDMVAATLAAGKHAICEKPLTSSLEKADAMIALAARSKARVMPIFQYRFGQGFQKALHLVRSGLAGKPYVASVETAWRRGADYYKVPWRGKFATELGGVLLTQAIHIHDLFLQLMGSPRRLAAFKTTRVNAIEVEDCMVASLEMPDGSLASLTATLGSMRPTTRLRLCFENVSIERVCYDTSAPQVGDEPWEVTPANTALAEPVARALAAAPRVKPGFSGQFALFHEAIMTGGEFPVTLSQARASLELITAIYEASEAGSRVELPIPTGHPRYRSWSARA